MAKYFGNICVDQNGASASNRLRTGLFPSPKGRSAARAREHQDTYPMKHPNLSRRNFVKKTAAAGSFFVLPSGLWADSPNSRICLWTLSGI